MPHHPAIATLTPAPLRNRIRAALDAPLPSVWALIGDLARFPEYSAGLERVEPALDSDGRCTEYVCHFKPVAEGQPGIVDRNIMRLVRGRSRLRVERGTEQRLRTLRRSQPRDA
jgi:hypothetical protein